MELKFVIFVLLIVEASAREVELESFTPSRNSDWDLIDYGTMRVTKVKKNNFVIAGDFEVKKNVGNEVTLVFEIIMPNGAVLLKHEHPFCDFIKSDKLIYPDLEKSSNFPKNKPCPFPRGNYTIKNYVFDDSKIGATPPGKYRAVATAIDSLSGKVMTKCEVKATVRF